MILCAFSIVGSQSRGALIGGLAMVLFLWLKSKSKVVTGVALILFIPLLFVFMPQQWHDRMDTIGTYEQDASAMGRIETWMMALQIGNDRVTGGGFELWTEETFERYAPGKNTHDAHSIYFKVLAEHGWIGLAALPRHRIRHLANRQRDRQAGQGAGGPGVACGPQQVNSGGPHRVCGRRGFPRAVLLRPVLAHGRDHRGRQGADAAVSGQSGNGGGRPALYAAATTGRVPGCTPRACAGSGQILTQPMPPRQLYTMTSFGRSVGSVRYSLE